MLFTPWFLVLVPFQYIYGLYVVVVRKSSKMTSCLWSVPACHSSTLWLTSDAGFYDVDTS